MASHPDLNTLFSPLIIQADLTHVDRVADHRIAMPALTVIMGRQDGVRCLNIDSAFVRSISKVCTFNPWTRVLPFYPASKLIRYLHRLTAHRTVRERMRDKRKRQAKETAHAELVAEGGAEEGVVAEIEALIETAGRAGAHGDADDLLSAVEAVGHGVGVGVGGPVELVVFAGAGGVGVGRGGFGRAGGLGAGAGCLGAGAGAATAAGRLCGGLESGLLRSRLCGSRCGGFRLRGYVGHRRVSRWGVRGRVS